MTQDEALAILESGQSVLLTGAAGTGKTYILGKFIKRARQDGQAVSVTATTGLAATHLNGATIHSWAGIGIHDELPKNHLQKISKQRRDIIKKTDILIIDEISMMHDFRLDIIDEVLRHVRESDEAFGGLQVVLCGDFFQLPPINRNESRQGSFVIASNVWQQGNFTVCYLEKQYRQSDDDDYRDILNGIRAGVLTRRQLDVLQSRSNVTDDPFTIRTRLLTTNADVDAINLEHLARIDQPSHEYMMETAGGKAFVEQLKRSCLAPEVLQLKKGASVMCIKNSTEKKYVNGSLGVVEDFEKGTDYPVVRLNTGKLITIKPDSWELIDGDKHRASLTQLPLRLAWAITVHKSQGMTLDAARIDLRRAFVEGMGYVALSRVRGMRHLVLDGLNSMALRVSPIARDIDSDLRARSAQALADNEKTIKKWQAAQKNRKSKPTKQIVKSGWNEKLQKMRLEYPNAYRPWKKEDDQKLQTLFSSGIKLDKLTKSLGRHPGSITKRLQKYYGEDVFVA
jgi:ATP-dependent DNA helicase PIF1